MELDQFKIDFGQLNNYVNSTDKMHIVVDFTAVMRSSASELFRCLRGLSRSCCCFYVSKLFDKKITQLVDDKESGFCSEAVLNSIIPAWEEYSCLNLHTMEEETNSYRFFKQLCQTRFSPIRLTCVLSVSIRSTRRFFRLPW